MIDVKALAKQAASDVEYIVSHESSIEYKVTERLEQLIQEAVRLALPEPPTQYECGCRGVCSGHLERTALPDPPKEPESMAPNVGVEHRNQPVSIMRNGIVVPVLHVCGRDIACAACEIRDLMQDNSVLSKQVADLQAQIAQAKRHSYAHMCRDEHEQIGHNDSEHELCPMCRMKNELEAQIKTLRAERAWRPIESAPKDGTEILVMWTLDATGKLDNK